MKAKTVLMAYQDDSWVESLTEVFHDKRYRVETARMVSEILQRIRGMNSSVVLLDDEIEGIKACDLIPLLKKLNPRAQIIVLSAEESIGVAKRLRGAGIFYQAMKPVDVEEIHSAVSCAFEKIEREQPEGWFFPFLIPGAVPA